MRKLLLCAAILGLIASIVGTRVEANTANRIAGAVTSSGKGYGCGCQDGECNGDDGCSLFSGWCYYHHYPLLNCCFYLWGGTFSCNDNTIKNWKCWDKDCYQTFRCGQSGYFLYNVSGPLKNGCG